jgi:hypothetical protein
MGSTIGFSWSIDPCTIDCSHISPPNTLTHDYPVGASSLDTTIDWYISPGFHFPSGGRIDSVKVNVFDIIGAATTVDSFVIYLLVGSRDPRIATKIRLVNLTNLASNDTSFIDTGNFIIPPVAGSSYVAFKYQATNDWFIPQLDNIHISGNVSTALDETKMHHNTAEIVADNRFLKVSLHDNSASYFSVSMMDMAGRVVLNKDYFVGQTAAFDISTLPTAQYIVRVISNEKECTVKKISIIR